MVVGEVVGDGGEAALHIDPVVGVAAGGVEFGEQGARIVECGRGGVHPGDGERGVEGFGHRLSAAVVTGASQRRLSSSSRTRSEIEAPAMSRLVT